MKYRVYIPAKLIFCFILLINSGVSFGQPLPDLIPYVDKGKWGYADTNGKVRIKPQWDEAWFFVNGKAIVRKQEDPNDRTTSVYCLIDKSGNLIIPPDRKWTGQFKGWKGNLNARNEKGNWGMIDTNNQVLIPFEWQQGNNFMGYTSFDTVYKDVYKDFKLGIINRENQLVVDCNYGMVSPMTDADKKLIGFRVSTTASFNNNGVVAPGNKILLPLKYYEIEYHETPQGKGFKVSRIQPDSPQTIWKWVDIKTGEETELSENLRKGHHYEKKFGYILFGHGRFGLMDTNYKELIPCCDIARINEDTITIEQVLDTARMLYRDSIPILLKALNTRTLRPYYTRKIKREGFLPMMQKSIGQSHGYGCGGSGLAIPEMQIPTLNNGGKAIETDSVLYTVKRYAPTSMYFSPYLSRIRNTRQLSMLGCGDCLILVKGSRNIKAGDDIEYNAIVDGDGNFITPPIKDHYIRSYNISQKLLTVQEDWRNKSYITDVNGNYLSSGINKDVAGAIRINGKLYAILEGNVLADSMGDTIRSLAKYTMSVGHFRDDGKDVLVVQDQSGSKGFVTTDGNILFKEISFKYKNIYPFSPYVFAVKTDLTENYLLLNREGKLISSNEGVTSITLATNGMSVVNDTGNSDTGVFSVDEAGVSYYMDKYGRKYKNK